MAQLWLLHCINSGFANVDARKRMFCSLVYFFQAFRHYAQLRLTCHVIRMPDERLPKKVFCGQVQEVNRSQGDQKKHYKDTSKHL